MRVTAVIGLIGAGLLLAGCGSGTVSGDADAEGTAAGEPVFSPCMTFLPICCGKWALTRRRPIVSSGEWSIGVESVSMAWE
ncbi:hypothetical protein GS575_33155 [Rhodococcus hoagii]|nr:hypothetical protein [Prescottella equi]